MSAAHPTTAPIAGNFAQRRALAAGETASPLAWNVRAATPGDSALVAEMLLQLSAETLWNRFGMALHPLSVEQAKRLAERMLGGGAAHQTLLVLDGPAGAEQVIAVAQLCATAPGCAEFALLIADAFQGQGLGRMLFDLLVRLARETGVEELAASMRATNTPMVRLVRGAGLPISLSTSGGESEVLLRLAAAAAPMLALFAGGF